MTNQNDDEYDPQENLWDEVRKKKGPFPKPGKYQAQLVKATVGTGTTHGTEQVVVTYRLSNGIDMARSYFALSSRGGLNYLFDWFEILGWDFPDRDFLAAVLEQIEFEKPCVLIEVRENQNFVFAKLLRRLAKPADEPRQPGDDPPEPNAVPVRPIKPQPVEPQVGHASGVSSTTTVMEI